MVFHTKVISPLWLLMSLVLAMMAGLVSGFNGAQAARIGGLYTAELLVAEQSVRVKPGLVSQALQQVLIKVSGRQDSLDQATIVAELADASRYIQQFSYQNTTQTMATGDGREVLAHRLIIDFEATLVDELLARANIRPLGTIRPGVLVWMMEERGGKREFLGLDEDPAFMAMIQRARERGLPIFRPLLDMDDQNALAVGDAWGFFIDPIKRASGRYQADSILVGRLYRDIQGQWLSQWLLLKSNDDSQRFDSQGQSLQNHLGAAIDQAADRLFADFVAPAGELDPGTVLLEVEAVTSIDSYFQIQQYLEELPTVKGVKLQQLSGDRLLLLLDIDGSLNQISGAIGLNSSFQPLPAYGNDGWLSYRWQP